MCLYFFAYFLHLSLHNNISHMDIMSFVRDIGFADSVNPSAVNAAAVSTIKVVAESKQVVAAAVCRVKFRHKGPITRALSVRCSS
jgi:hypothetical protein